jgi:hypothetical protein
VAKGWLRDCDCDGDCEIAIAISRLRDRNCDVSVGHCVVRTVAGRVHNSTCLTSLWFLKMGKSAIINTTFHNES